ncbi:MAG: glycosyltransferase family 87 protein [Nocardioidaceae bacterium]
MPFLESSRSTGDVVAPTRTDPIARSASGAVGGPLGRQARTAVSWWTPLRVIILVATVVFGLGVFQKSPCVVTNWSQSASPLPFSHMCYSDIQPLYVARGLAEGIPPYQPQSDLPANKQPADVQQAHDLTVEYPVLTGVWMGASAVVTHLVGDDPDLAATPHSAIGGNPQVQHDTAVFWSVNAVGFFLVLVIALALLVKAQRRRPWDAMFVAASPALALAATINWDMLAVGCVAGILWAWSTRRPILTGVFIGLGVATKLYPLFFLGPLLVLCMRERRLDAWTKTCAAALLAWLAVDLPVYYWSPDAFLWFWQFNASRGADYGSVWLVASDLGHVASVGLINTVTWVVFGAACLLIGVLGLLAPRRPRVVQLVFLVVASFLLVNKVYSPQYVLWLLPLAALARPRWRDMIIWQACEIFYFFAVWMHIANFFVAEGSFDWVYALSVAVRIAGEVYLMVLVVRDIMSPWHDPVRSDGLSDDPLGGILDEGIDSEPELEPTPTLARATS